MKEPNLEEACEDALAECSSGSCKLTKLELREIPAEFYLDPRCKKMTVLDISFNALQSIPKVTFMSTIKGIEPLGCDDYLLLTLLALT